MSRARSARCWQPSPHFPPQEKAAVRILIKQGESHFQQQVHPQGNGSRHRQLARTGARPKDPGCGSVYGEGKVVREFRKMSAGRSALNTRILLFRQRRRRRLLLSRSPLLTASPNLPPGSDPFPSLSSVPDAVHMHVSRTAARTKGFSNGTYPTRRNSLCSVCVHLLLSEIEI